MDWLIMECLLCTTCVCIFMQPFSTSSKACFPMKMPNNEFSSFLRRIKMFLSLILDAKKTTVLVFCPLSYEKMGKNSGLRFYNLSSLICWLIYETVHTRLVALLIEKLHFTWHRLSRRKAAATLTSTTFNNFDFNPSRNLQILKRFREASEKQQKFFWL